MDEEIMVSVLMPVYNHESYVSQAIESVIMQKTNFKYELIIGEDCSTDNSKKIIQKYEKEYPDIVKAIYQPVNKGMYKNGNMIKRMAKGKYWAFCEGDDYWTDSNKLQKQVDFLENNSKFSAVYHNVVCVDKRGRVCKRKSINKYPFKPEKSYSFDMVKEVKLVGQTASLLCRNVYTVINADLFEAYRGNGDNKICAIMACVGEIHYMEDIMACHRVVLNEGDSWSARTYGKNRCLQIYTYYTNVCKLLRIAFGKDWYDKEYENRLRKDSINELYRRPSWKNLMIWLLVSGKYIKNEIIFGICKRYM